jgi:hypothetical protein
MDAPNFGCERAATLGDVAGGVVMVIILLLFPFVVTVSSVLLAGLLGTRLDSDARARNEGSELLDTNY